MFLSIQDQHKFIKETYQEITDKRIDDSHWDLLCTKCQVVRGFQVTNRYYTTQETSYTRYPTIDWHAPFTLIFRCPVCTAYKIWIIFKIAEERKSPGGVKTVEKYFKITSLPNEGMDEIEELPEKPLALRIAYRQAVRSMDANAPLAAAAMFRRALQVITREILHVTPGNLANELKEVVGKEYDGFKIENDFSDNAYIIKEAGNQGAHPDADPDLLDFTDQDAVDLQQIFLEMVSDLFIVPDSKRRTKQEFMQRRKITIPSKR